jgi:hypothetical protein
VRIIQEVEACQKKETGLSSATSSIALSIQTDVDVDTLKYVSGQQVQVHLKPTRETPIVAATAAVVTPLFSLMPVSNDSIFS